MMAEKEYTYTYEEGRLHRAAECAITVNDDGMITSKTLVNSVLYVYNEEGTLIRKRILPANGAERVIYYETTDENTVVKFTAGGKTVTSHSKTDSFGRKVFDELQLGTGFVSRQFSYHLGEPTETHKEEEKLRSSPTTQLVSQILLADGRTLSYTYDPEERITAVVETYKDGEQQVTHTTEYTYDAQGQLLEEKVNDQPVNTMEYDCYGNITKKNGKVYTYSKDDGENKNPWKDKLIAYDGQEITYDSQGNPLNYLGHTLTWEKGRQLKSFDGITYTYNANGIRTSKTIGNTEHTYTLDGTKILCEAWKVNETEYSIVPMYDNEDSVCGIVYNGEPYYFYKNLQGDVIAIVNRDAETVARYTYDAWGVCTITQDSTACNIATINPYRYRGYYFDAEIGMYYLQSRYYDASISRFINGDQAEIIAFSSVGYGNNLFAYCSNSPANHKDSSGYAVETAFDIASILWSLFDLINKPSWANVGFLLWDIASLIPFLPGSYVVKGGKIGIKVASKIDDFIDGTKFLTGTYKKLKKVFKWISNIEVHHLIEKRFKKLFKKICSTDDFLSIPLTKDLHKIITKRWREYFPYGMNYSKITKSQMRKAIKYVYRDMPQLLEETLKWFEKAWKK